MTGKVVIPRRDEKILNAVSHHCGRICATGCGKNTESPAVPWVAVTMADAPERALDAESPSRAAQVRDSAAPLRKG